jgi:hypothetical protein
MILIYIRSENHENESIDIVALIFKGKSEEYIQQVSSIIKGNLFRSYIPHPS